MESWPTLKNSIPPNIIQAATQPYTPKVGEYVAFTPDDTSTPPYYAKAEHDPTSHHLRYHRQWIDTFGTPHDTGTYVTTHQETHDDKTQVALWITQDEEDAHYNFQQRHQQDQHDEQKPEPKTIGQSSY